MFEGAGKCATCHSGSAFTDANSKLHAPADSSASRSPTARRATRRARATKQYRTAPLRGVWQHPPYFHDGCAATLDAVVETYDSRKALGLTAAQKSDLVQYLKSL